MRCGFGARNLFYDCLNIVFLKLQCCLLVNLNKACFTVMSLKFNTANSKKCYKAGLSHYESVECISLTPPLKRRFFNVHIHSTCTLAEYLNTYTDLNTRSVLVTKLKYKYILQNRKKK